MAPLQIPFHPFRAELAFVEREFFPRFKANNVVLFDFELDAALHSAEAAMGFYEPFWLATALPSPGRNVCQVWAELFLEDFGGRREFSHVPSLCSRGSQSPCFPSYLRIRE